jgi:uncharacterized membrane protein
MNKLALKISIGLVVLFVLGVFTGVVMARQTRWKGRWAGDSTTYEERWIAGRIEEYKTQLNLTPEQVAAIRPHFDKLASDLREFRAELRTKMAGAFKEMNAGIASELPPEQRNAFWKMLREKSEKTQRKRPAPPKQ